VFESDQGSGRGVFEGGEVVAFSLRSVRANGHEGEEHSGVFRWVGWEH
jgi:hypothetical protein